MLSVPTPHLSFKFRTGPASTPSLRKNVEATGKLLVLALWRSAKSGASTALRPAPKTPKRLCAGRPLYACRIPRSAAPLDGRASQGDVSRRESFCQPSFILKTQEIRFGIIIPHLLLNLYHFRIYVNDFLSCFLQVLITNRFLSILLNSILD